MARLRNEEMEEELVRYKLLSDLSPLAPVDANLIHFLLVMQKRCIRTRTPCQLIGFRKHECKIEEVANH